MFKAITLFISCNDEFRRCAVNYFCEFPITETKLSDQEMADIDHLWFGQPL